MISIDADSCKFHDPLYKVDEKRQDMRTAHQSTSGRACAGLGAYSTVASFRSANHICRSRAWSHWLSVCSFAFTGYLSFTAVGWTAHPSRPVYHIHLCQSTNPGKSGPTWKSCLLIGASPCPAAPGPSRVSGCCAQWHFINAYCLV